MAAIYPRRVEGTETGETVTWMWENIGQTDTPQPLKCPGLADKSFQVIGTFDGATVGLHGSNLESSGFGVLTDPLGIDIEFTVTAQPKQVSELTAFVKPVASGGGGSQSITAYITGKKS